MLSLKRFSILILVICSAAYTAACTAQQATLSAESPPARVIILAGADATITPTPFLPLPPTPTYIPTSFPTPLPPAPQNTAIPYTIARSWSDYPGPTVWPDIDVPAPVGLLAQPANQTNILLLGSDQRPAEGGFRTDTILLITLSPDLGIASITSFPRDLYVYIPGYTVQRINTAFAFGGFDTLSLTFEYNFGVRPDHYALINFWSFTQVVDSLGGIDVNVALPLTDHRDGYGYYTVPAGLVHMDGETALWYARSRYSTSDFDRGRRQQEIIIAGFQKLISLNALQRAPQLYEIYRENVITDMTFDQMSKFIPLASQLRDTSRIYNYYIGPQQVYAWVNYSGSQVLVPMREPVLEVMRQALNTP